ncbi:MAG: type II toxin-antitoxin system HipA family toxin [bacterium]|nr:type II toxin-antitoxin system HipA family toxin [bacterium]
MELNVFLNAYGVRQHIGRLGEVKRRIYFEYAPEFLKTGIALSPFKLPLQTGVFVDREATFEGLFGLFNDSLPDGWGCLLLDRKLQEQGLRYAEITPLHRLSLIGKNPMGALEYEPAHDTPGESHFEIQLDALSREVDAILAASPTAVLDHLLQCHGSSGGARPKITACVSADATSLMHTLQPPPEGYTPWIIKFIERADGLDFGEKEYRFSLAAKAAGIVMPKTHLFPSRLHAGYFGVERFDRTPCGHKIHIHSACGLLHASHRYPSLDYENLLKLTALLTHNHEDVKQMALRMIFNVKSGNRDDHSKNFSFLLDRSYHWHLAPAYDLTPSAGLNGEQTAMVNGKGHDITDKDLIATALKSNISEKETLQMIHTVEKALHDIL